MEQIGSRELAAIFCATTVCARQTAAALAEQLGARVRIDEDLRNLDHGLWQGKRFDELKQTQPRVYRSWAEHPESVAPPGGETIASAQERVQQFLRRLFRRFKTGTVAIVAAEPLATIVRSAILNQPIDNFWQAERRFGDWETIALKS
jgi:probable phosphoglycerate mutase